MTARLSQRSRLKAMPTSTSERIRYAVRCPQFLLFAIFVSCMAKRSLNFASGGLVLLLALPLHISGPRPHTIFVFVGMLLLPSSCCIALPRVRPSFRAEVRAATADSAHAPLTLSLSLSLPLSPSALCLLFLPRS